jgi:HPt (histidine-containing phosphotransfer) domain-containing protein
MAYNGIGKYISERRIYMNIHIDGINVADGLKRFAGNEKLYTKSLLRFASEYPPPPFETAEDERKKYAHMVKGVAGNLGIYELAEKAAAAEQDLSDAGKHSEFASLMTDVGEKITQAFAETGGAPAKPAAGGERGGRNEYVALAKQLRLAAERFNPSECEKALEKLRSKSWDDITVSSLDAVSKAIDDYDFVKILDIVPQP